MKLLPVILTWLIFINAHAFESFSYSGRLVNSNGSPVTGYAKLTFELAYSNSISSILCAQTINSVSLSNGVFHVELQFSDCDLTQIVKDTPNGHTLSIRVIDRTQTPERSYPFQAIHALPYAYVSKTAKQLDQLGAAPGQVLTWEAGEWKPKTIMTEITDGSITDEMLQGNIPRTKLAVGTPDEFVVNDASGNLSSVDASTVRSLIGAMTFTDVDQCLSHQKLQMNPGPVFWSCVDDLTEDNTKLPLTGGTVTGPLILSGDPVSALEATTKEYVDSAVDAIDPKVTGSLKFKPNAFEVEIKASSSTSENLEFILPPAKGTAGQALVTDGNGNLSWAAPAAADSSGVGGDLTGTVSNAVIKTGIVTSDKIADGTITNADIAALADIEQSKIKDLALALSNKENKIVGGAAGEYWDGSRSWVILNTSKVPETTNLYFTEERARSAISANGPLIFDDTTGVMSFLSPGASGNLLRSNGTTWESWIPNFLTAESDSLQAVTDRGATTTTFSKFMGGARFSQIGIGTDTPVGVLDIQSTTSGILIPRMSEGQRDLIASPTGMQIYNTSTNKINFHDGSSWKELGLAGSGVQSLTAGSGLLGGTISSTGTISVNTGTGADQIVKLDSSSKLPAVDGSALTNLNPSSLSTFVPISKGGTGLTAFTPDRVYVSDISGSLVPFMCSVDQLFGFDSFGKPYCISYNTFIKQNGNSFGGPAVIGTNDNQPLHFETNSSVKMAILSNGNVGIGVSNPTTKLEVVGTSGTTLKIVDGNQAVGKVLTSDANGIASWQTTTNGTVTNVTGSGPITVSSGTTTPVIGIDTANTSTAGALTSTDWNTFNNKLSSSLASGKIFVGNGSNVATAVSMSGDATLSNAGVLTLGTVPLSKGGTGATTQAGAANAILPSQTGNSGKFLTTNGTNASWGSALTSESDTLATITGRGASTATAVSLNGGATFPGNGIWNSSGNVGIGTATPNVSLDVIGNINLGARLSSYVDGANNAFWMAQGTAPESDRIGFGIQANPATGVVSSTHLRTNGVQRVTVDSTGRVGIGTVNPEGMLQLGGDTTPGDLILKAGTALSGDAGDIIFKTNAGSQIGRIWTDTLVGGLFLTGRTSNTSDLFLTTTGNVGIGTTTPTQKLTVAGTIETTSGGVKYPDGTVQTTAANSGFQIKKGTIGACTPGSAGSSGSVTFPTAFPGTPIVQLTVVELDNAGCTSARIIAISATGFSWNSFVGGTASTCDCIYWTAFY